VSEGEKKSVNVLLIGCGDIGTEIARRLLARGDSPVALRRNVGLLPQGMPAQAVDYTDRRALSVLNSLPCDAAVFTPTPPGRDAEAYRLGYLAPVRNLLSLWQDSPPRTLFYVSSTRVYGDAGGDWVDESSPLNPGDAQAEVLCEAEALLLESHHDVTVVRFSGIYGREPSRLLQRIARGELVRPTPPHYSNRIHREDCIGFLLHLLDMPQREALYLASDGEPALSFEVERWLAGELGVVGARECVDPPAASRRCRTDRMQATAYRLRYPDFRAGYIAMMTSTSISAPLGSAAT
jgi:nucleoside-diphosphate-sugar epimerase